MTAEPLLRRHEETLRFFIQEIEAISVKLKSQLSVVEAFDKNQQTQRSEGMLPKLTRLEIDLSRDELVRQCLSHIGGSIDHFESLLHAASQLGEWHRNQLKSNKDHQEHAIMMFTVVTVIFLPLSFVATLLGMNTNDVRNMEMSQWIYWASALPLTLLVVGCCSLWLIGTDKLGSWTRRVIWRLRSTFDSESPVGKSVGWEADRATEGPRYGTGFKLDEKTSKHGYQARSPPPNSRGDRGTYDVTNGGRGRDETEIHIYERRARDIPRT